VTRLGIRSGESARAEASVIAKRIDAELVVIDGAEEPAVLLAALRDGRVDAVLVPAAHLGAADLDAPDGGLTLAAIPKRRDARDALTGDVPLDAIAPGTRISVGTALRRAQLLERRRDLLPVTGSDADAVIQITAVVTLDDPDVAGELFDLADWPTAPGQGALAVIARRGENSVAAKADHRPSRLTVLVELAVLDRVGPAVGATLAANAEIADGLLFVSARVYDPEGGGRRTSSHALYPEDSPDPVAELAARVAAELLAPAGGGEPS
jgi:hydroxymethylbilane synthase